MNRREFSTQALGIGIATATAGLSPLALAQQGNAPVEGKHYVKLSQPVPVASGKIEVIEFFWYGCPHCNEFEPMLDAWSRQLASDVAFRRVPVAFRTEPFVTHQKIFYALDELGLIPTMHRKVFYAIHGRRMRLDKPQEIGDFMQSQGVDSVKFLDRMESFSVQSKATQARKLAADYKIDGVPAIGIQGRYYTSGGLIGSLEGVVAVSNFLIDKVRNKG